MSRKFIVINDSDGCEYDSLKEMAEDMDEEELDEIESGDKIVVVEIEVEIVRKATITTPHKEGGQAFCQCEQCRQ